MKRFIFAFILLVVSFTVVGCSKEEEQRKTKEPTPELTPLEKVNALMRSKQLPFIREIHEWKDYPTAAAYEIVFYKTAWEIDSIVRNKDEQGRELTRKEKSTLQEKALLLKKTMDLATTIRETSLMNGILPHFLGYYGSFFNSQNTVETVYYFNPQIEKVTFIVKKRIREKE